jgi:hypothetical protein
VLLIMSLHMKARMPLVRKKLLEVWEYCFGSVMLKSSFLMFLRRVSMHCFLSNKNY